ncbi:MAG: Asp-tRNA(Asn)/Glu-tRNA(Gln) amidotransferase subunit GatC [Candidatus Berkelbacteria bacterium]
MAKITTEEIRHIAKLSRLDLTDAEVTLYGDQLSGVLDYVAELQKVDTENVADCNNVTGLENVWRDDTVVASGISADDVAINAPKFENGSFVVPGVFE